MLIEHVVVVTLATLITYSGPLSLKSIPLMVKVMVGRLSILLQSNVYWEGGGGKGGEKGEEGRGGRRGGGEVEEENDRRMTEK